MSKNSYNLGNVGMSQEHRKKIQSNFDILVRECNLDALLPKLIEKQVFSLEMAEKYMDSDKRKSKCFLFLDIRTRGPEAFYKLVTSLRETRQDHLADLLSCATNTNSLNDEQCALLQKKEMCKKQAKPFMQPKQDIEINVEVAEEEIDSNTVYSIPVLRSKKFYDNLDSKVRCYSTRSQTRGKVLIINNIEFVNDCERVGAEVDENNLLQLFNQMGGFSVQPYVNKTYQETKSIIRDFVKSPDLIGVDMCFVFILSHGLENKIETTDGAYISTNWIEEQFNNVNCPLLVSKPKILIYQTCRGEKLHYIVRDDVQTDSPDTSDVQIQNRAYSDLLICHSTVLGYKSHRDTHFGTWFIEKFCLVMKEHAHDTHIENLLKMIDDSIAKLRSRKNFSSQTSTYNNIGFNSHCYIHPGIYEENGQMKKYSM